VDVYEQMANLPSMKDQEKICKGLFTEVLAVLVDNGVDVDFEKSSYRVKSREGIEGKIKTRGSNAPMRDIDGIRVVVADKDRNNVTGMILDAFPLTPSNFPDGRPSVRDYASPSVRVFIRANFNPNISSEYSALHINVVFKREGSDIYEIAEVQIMTEEEYTAYFKTREIYKNGRGKNGNQR